MKKLNWGILSTSAFAQRSFIPAAQKSSVANVYAIASRNLDSAKAAAEKMGIPNAYGSYEELIDDDSIDVIYNPLPNHMHVEWTAKAIRKGKHVLCEKPLFINPEDAAELIRLRDEYKVKVGEAFMVKSHPQWQKARELVETGAMGDVSQYLGTFNYFNDDAKNIRNVDEYGGGALWDIGCYTVMTSRYIFGENPLRAISSIKRDAKFNTDILSAVILEYPNDKKAIFTVSTQTTKYQRVHILGTEKAVEIMIPFNAPDDRPSVVKVNPGDILLENIEEIKIDTCNHYIKEVDDFTAAIHNDTRAPVTLEDALDHCNIIHAIFKSAKTGTWVDIPAQ
ncbi:MAG: Gfo/Idh/MocA family protein [Bacteroidota bacterium]